MPFFDERFDAERDSPLDPRFDILSSSSDSGPAPAAVAKIKAMNFKLYYSSAENATISRAFIRNISIKGQLVNLGE